MRAIILFIILLLSSSLFAQWPTSPDSAIVLGGYAEYKQAVPDLHGGAYVVWGTTQTNCARINRSGEIVWIEGQFLDSEPGDEASHQSLSMSSDSCLLVSYKTSSFTVPFELGNAEIRVQKIDSLGNKLWAEGIVLTPENLTGEGLSIHFILSKISHTTDGGAYAAWTDYRGNPPDLGDLYMQRIGPAGNILWDSSGVQIGGQVGYLIKANTNYLGDFQLVYQQGAWGSPVHKVLRVTQGGTSLYEDGGNVFPVNYANLSSYKFGANGDIYCAQDSRIYGIDSSGSILWPEGRIFSSSSEQIKRIEEVDRNGLVVLYHDSRPSIKTIIQHINNEGTLSFGLNGLELFDGRSSRSSIVVSDSCFIVTRRDVYHYAVKLDYVGENVWEAPSVIYNDANGGTSSPISVPDMHGGLIYFFMENWGLLATHLNSDGSLGRYVNIDGAKELFHPQSYSLTCYPNPFNPSTTIGYELPEYLEVSLIIYDITGREVQTLVSTSQAAGSYDASWDGTNHDGHQVAAGMYFARLKGGGNSSTVKLVYLN